MTAKVGQSQQVEKQVGFGETVLMTELFSLSSELSYYGEFQIHL